MQHLVFYDGECGLCDRTVQFLLKADKKDVCVFAPLKGITALQMLKDLPPSQKNADSVILVENWETDPKFCIRSKAIFRIFWLLGGWWSLLGWLNFLPAFLFDWAYRLVAHYRHQLFSKITCPVPDEKTRHRFLK